MGTRTRTMLALAMALVVAATVAAPAVQAEDRRDEIRDVEAPLRDGEWLGSLGFSTRLQHVEDGVTVDYRGTFDGQFFLDVAGGTPSGEWDLSGIANFDFSGPATGSARISHNARGPLTGDQQSLHMTGRDLVQGTASMQGQSIGIGPFDNPVDPFTIAVESADCNMIVGDFEAALAAALADQGLSPVALEGHFVGYYYGEHLDTSFQDRMEEFHAEYDAWVDEVRDTGEFDRQRMTDLLNQATDLEYERRYEVEDECIFGNRLGRFAYFLTVSMQQLALFLLLEFDLTGHHLSALVDNLLFVGGLGAGAPVPQLAAEITALIVEQGQRVIDDHLVTDGQQRDGTPCSTASPCLNGTAEIEDLAVWSAKIGATYTIGGEEFSAADIAAAIVDGGGP